MIPACIRRRIGETFMAGYLVVGLFAHSGAQSEQRIDVTIKDFTFVTRQIPLRLDVPTVISIRNVDPERHDFGSSMFDGVPTRIDSAGVITYGRGSVVCFLTPSGKRSFVSHWIALDGTNFVARSIRT